METPSDLAVRVGDAERDACVAALIEHYVGGRLDTAELDRRQHAALQATTVADLEVLLVDLPLRSPDRGRAALAAPQPGAVVPFVASAGVIGVGAWLWSVGNDDYTLVAAAANGGLTPGSWTRGVFD
jgi:hypothetical protein